METPKRNVSKDTRTFWSTNLEVQKIIKKKLEAFKEN